MLYYVMKPIFSLDGRLEVFTRHGKLQADREAAIRTAKRVFGRCLEYDGCTTNCICDATQVQVLGPKLFDKKVFRAARAQALLFI